MSRRNTLNVKNFFEYAANFSHSPLFLRFIYLLAGDLMQQAVVPHYQKLGEKLLGAVIDRRQILQQLLLPVP